MHVTTHASNPQEVSLDTRVLLPIVDGDLGQPDWASGIDSKGLVLAYFGVFGVLSEGRDARRVPKGTGWGLVNSCTVDDDVDPAEFLECCLP